MKPDGRGKRKIRLYHIQGCDAIERFGKIGKKKRE